VTEIVTRGISQLCCVVAAAVLFRPTHMITPLLLSPSLCLFVTMRAGEGTVASRWYGAALVTVKDKQGTTGWTFIWH